MGSNKLKFIEASKAFIFKIWAKKFFYLIFLKYAIWQQRSRLGSKMNACRPKILDSALELGTYRNPFYRNLFFVIRMDSTRNLGTHGFWVPLMPTPGINTIP